MSMSSMTKIAITLFALALLACSCGYENSELTDLGDTILLSDGKTDASTNFFLPITIAPQGSAILRLDSDGPFIVEVLQTGIREDLRPNVSLHVADETGLVWSTQDKPEPRLIVDTIIQGLMGYEVIVKNQHESLYLAGFLRVRPNNQQTIEKSYSRIGAGSSHTCVIREDGEVECWGDNIWKQLNSPAGVKFKSISTSDNHTCGIREDGEVECWGANEGEVFMGKVLGGFYPPTGVIFKSISAGGQHSCGMREDGEVECWGSTGLWGTNPHGELNAPVGVKFKSITAGKNFTCGIKENGDVECWGDNTDGQLDAPVGVKFKSISPGFFHACGLRDDGEVECWGNDFSGKGSPPAGVHFKEINAGARHNCGIREDGGVECWGLDKYGQATPPAAVR